MAATAVRQAMGQEATRAVLRRPSVSSMTIEFRPLLGPSEWDACEAAVYSTAGAEAVGLTYRHPALGRLSVDLASESVSARSPARFFRNAGRTWQAQERVLDGVPQEREGAIEVEGEARPVVVATFGTGLWAAQTIDAAPVIVSLVSEGWPVDGLALVQVPSEAFPDEEWLDP